MSPSFETLPCRNEDGAYHVVVESPRGARVKLTWDEGLGAFVFGRALVLGVTYPYDFGFVASTLAADGDPLDAMVICDAGTWPGVVIPAIPIGLVRLVEREGNARKSIHNDRVIAVPADDARYKTVRQLQPRVRAELESFFATVADLTGKTVVVQGWQGPKAARDAIARAARAFTARKGG
jgi:inorganic pyrophosphatase